MFFLLAEGDPTFHLSVSTLVTLGGIIAGTAGTLAVLKFRASATEDKQKGHEKIADELKAKDEKIEEAIRSLGTRMESTGDSLGDKIADLEHRQSEKTNEFQSKVMNRFDRMDETLSDHEKRLAVAENDREHMKREHHRVARKVTMMPKD
jgi:gas vesicle protein